MDNAKTPASPRSLKRLVRLREVVEKLGKASGWRLRSDIEEHLNDCRMSVASAQCHLEAKQWEMMIREIHDAVDSVDKLKALLPNHSLSDKSVGYPSPAHENRQEGGAK